MHSLLDPTSLLHTFGYVGIFAILFLESGIVIGFFLPGDSLLFAAGLLAAHHSLNLIAVIVTAIIAAILGNSAGYLTGKQFGPALFDRPKSRWFSPKRVHEAHAFFQKQGAQSLILARFIPAVRTFVPIIAGVGEMRYRTFLLFNAVGGLLWGSLVPVLGFTLGKTVHDIDQYLLPIILLIAIISILPMIIGYAKARKKSEQSKTIDD